MNSELVPGNHEQAVYMDDSQILTDEERRVQSHQNTVSESGIEKLECLVCEKELAPEDAYLIVNYVPPEKTHDESPPILAAFCDPEHRPKGH